LSVLRSEVTGLQKELTERRAAEVELAAMEGRLQGELQVKRDHIKAKEVGGRKCE
jgi:hypothetical protein